MLYRMRFRSLRHALLLSVAIISGCSGGTWLLPTLYNRLDNMMAGRFLDYADFDDSQRRFIKQGAREYHDWHRVNELPAYAGFMQALAIRLNAGEPTLDTTEVANWAAWMDARNAASQQCNPVNDAGEFLVAVSDEQVEQIEAHINELYDEFMEEYQSETASERARESTRTAVKWLRRMGLDLNDAQREHLHDTILEQAGSRGAFFELWYDWSLQLVALLQQRQRGVTAADIEQHLQQLSGLSRNADPERYQRNRQRWIRYFAELGSSLDKAQRTEFGDWLQETAATLMDISRDRDGLVAAEILPESRCPRGPRDTPQSTLAS